MDRRKGIIALGVGATTFLVGTVVIIELLGGDFPSALIALPIGVVAGVVTAAGTYLRLGAHTHRVVQSAAVGLAAFSYVLFSLWLLRYAFSIVRPVLTFTLIIIVSLIGAGASAVLAWIQYPILPEDEPTLSTGGR